MEANLSPDFRKWIRKCLGEQFRETIDKHLENDRNSTEVAQKVIESKEMKDLLQLMKSSLSEEKSRPDSEFPDGCRSLTSISCASDLSGDEWITFKGTSGRYAQLLERIETTRPVHVRLAGYEAFLKRELSGIFSIQNWDYFLKTLRDGIADDSRPVFEASLQLHAKLLNSPQPVEIYGNLMTAFDEQYQSRKMNDVLPTLVSGVNFKVLVHEKLIRIMSVIVRHLEEVLKGVRTVDKSLEELIEQFVIFVSTHNFSSPIQVKTLSPLNILSILEPEASWSGKWIHSLTTRKAFCNALSKSPSLLSAVIQITTKGLGEAPYAVSLSVTDEPGEVFISGDTVETMTYLHSLTLLAQISSYSTGRSLLSETQIENPFSVTDFVTALLTSLNVLASSEIPSVIYEVSRRAFRYILHKPAILYDARFYHIAFNPLMSSGDRKIFPHTLDVTMHMLDTADGASFMGSETRLGSAKIEESSAFPAVAVLEHTADLLRQPLSVMNVELVADLFAYIGRLLTIYEVYEITQETLETKLYPAIAYFYGKLDKYAVENEIKTQFLNSASKNMLLKIVSMPLGLQLLPGETIVFEELIRGSIGPLRASWRSSDVVSFISNSASFSLGVKTLSELAPHVLSTLLNELCKLLENSHCFHDPWEERDVEIFLHVLTIFSLNTQCFIAFMSTDETSSDDENIYPLNLNELLQHSVNSDSDYHYLSLLSIRTVIWNLDIYLYLENSLNLENELLNVQRFCIIDSSDENYVTENHENYIVDECSILRHQILSDSYFVRQKRNEYIKQPEDCQLFSKFPPPQGPEEGFGRNSPSDTELEYFLQDDIPGLRDSGWVSQARKAFRNSAGPIKSDIMLSLLDQMQKAIPTVEWVDHFTWETIECSENYWHPEDLRGIELVLRYADLNGTLENKDFARENLKMFIQSSHAFIKYEKPVQFDGFDWFLSTVFIICNGDFEKSKTFVTQIVRFPSAIFMWPALADVVDKSNEEESTTRLLLAHLLEFLISKEFPNIKYAMKNKCGVDWWTISLRLCHQSFWGILPWDEIIHFYAICILNPPDYIIYYCVSLLNHCQTDFMENVMNGKIWPENMILEDYRCHSQIGYMDRLGKRYSGKLLPILTQRKLNFPEPN